MGDTVKPLTEMSDRELWELFPVIIVPHEACWAERYETEKMALAGAVGIENIRRISHIGSTAVKGLPAKPTIDILLEIADGCDTDGLTGVMESEGYIYSPQPRNPAPHMMFMKGYTPRGFEGQAFHVHVRYAGDWDELYFRDYLSAHPGTAEEYGKLKKRLQSIYKHDRDKYTEEKGAFIRAAGKLAREEFGGRYLEIPGMSLR